MYIPGPILVLDDDADDHAIIKMVCSNIGICKPVSFFFEAEDLIDFLKNSKEEPFLILCDVNMPMINGFQVAQKIQQDTSLRKKAIPFIFLSTSATSTEIKKA